MGGWEGWRVSALLLCSNIRYRILPAAPHVIYGCSPGIARQRISGGSCELVCVWRSPLSLFFFFMCPHARHFLLMRGLCSSESVCVCVFLRARFTLLSTGSFNTSRQSIRRGAMFGPVFLLKDALHRAVRAKSGEVNKTKPRVPLICFCFF